MPRIARVVVPGLPHHVTQRGNRRQRTFFSHDDYLEYLRLLGKWGPHHGLQIWAYCLMPNHVHLIVVPKEPTSLARAIGEVHRRYTVKINEREDWSGYLWQGRFFSNPMDERHLLAAIQYVLLNPVEAGLAETALEWPYSSARAHLAGKDDGVVRVAPLAHIVDDWKMLLRQSLPKGDVDRLEGHLRTGRPLGSDEFVEDLERRTGRSLKPRKRGPKKKGSPGAPGGPAN